VSDLVVVSTEEAILVCPRDRVQEVKLLVAELKRRGRADLV
jgi:mannose-1-phosphate guanylyltransferase